MLDLLESYADTIGMIGVVILLIAYFSISTGKLSSERLTYQFLNFLAAWLILVSLFFHWNTPSVLIEIAWILISMIGFFRILVRRGREVSLPVIPRDPDEA